MMKGPTMAAVALPLLVATTGIQARAQLRAEGPAPALFHDEEVTYPGPGITLAGTLSIPGTSR